MTISMAEMITIYFMVRVITTFSMVMAVLIGYEVATMKILCLAEKVMIL